MSNDLIPFEELGLPAPKENKPAPLAEALTQADDRLRRVQFMSSNSDQVKEGEFPPNSFALTDGSVFVDLGKEVDVVLLAFRGFAIDSEEGQIYYLTDPNTQVEDIPEAYKDIAKRSKTYGNGCMEGPQYLCYIPSRDEFATHLLASPSQKREDTRFQSLLYKAATLEPKKIQTKKYTYWIGSVRECNSITQDQLPDPERVKEEINKFLNPEEKPQAELADEDERDR